MSSILSALSSIWSSLLYKLGLWDKQASLLVLGLDNAGKTTLLHSLATGGQQRLFPPTDRPRIESFRYKGISFRAWDLGGHEAVRHLWADYYSDDNEQTHEESHPDGTHVAAASIPTHESAAATNVSAVLFLLDAADEGRLEEAGYELDHLLAPPTASGETQQPQVAVLHHVPVAVLCNKCDLAHAVSSQVICDKLDYARLQQMHAPNKMNMFRISVLTGQGYDEAFEWINSFL